MITDYYLKSCDLQSFIDDLRLSGAEVNDYNGGMYTGENIFINELLPIPEEYDVIDGNDAELIAELAMTGSLGVDRNGNTIRVISYICACHYNVRVRGMALDVSQFVNTEVMSPKTPISVIF